ncbi:MAG: hypothetical protein FJ010_07090 [Chloroflexi bacterium]|nr:hypothetical protein [Chloroflexota bacterium]
MVGRRRGESLPIRALALNGEAVSRISLVLKALCELGLRQLGLYALYQVGLHSSYFRWRTPDCQPPTAVPPPPSPVPRHLLELPDPASVLEIIGQNGLSTLIKQADEIVAGRVRLFGGEAVALALTPPGDLSHWTKYEQGSKGEREKGSSGSRGEGEQGGRGDIKFIWEPARFGWAFTLGRAYYLTNDERYPEAFWRYFELFQQANPVNRGPNWVSAQEVALRLIVFAFAAQIFSRSLHSTATRISQLATSIAAHATRIPPTLIYARAQNNNHLLSEAAGLITASLALPDHPQAPRWSNLGRKWFQHGLETQIAKDGAYMQHSVNYHRLMLQLALWVSCVTYQVSGENVTRDTWNLTLGSATRWLLALTDSETGRVPNLGPNDGAYILPLTVLPFHDYRPVLQAASQAFLSETAFGPGSWDEMGLWLCSSAKCQVPGVKCQVSSDTTKNVEHDTWHMARGTSPSTLHAPRSWAYLRAARFSDRPGHADQLHLDLWWRGLNVAQDAGTYLYNAEPPWDNALTHTAVHNTVMVESCDQMTRAGRFLYLGWAQAEIVAHDTAEDGSWQRLVARHEGYRRLGVIHQRAVTAYANGRWVVEDQLSSVTRRPSSVLGRLHWLLPDWEWMITDSESKIELLSPYGWIVLKISGQSSVASYQLVRAGELLHGSGSISPTWGWVSPTYGQKAPALSCSMIAESPLPITFTSEWVFPHDE